ncbi:MAG TPA: acetate/propionate family kinase, partial [Rhizobiales bacterium]|nr:acetate/propionate family kinase [Hyphomicrobiales bacterium]
YSPMAPNHQPHNLNAIRAVARAWPGVVQVACFDTAFHRSQPRLAQLFALPRHLSDEGILRYGFHGISYQYITNILASVAPHIANGRVIIAHLGHGASMCAIHNGRSVATTMGFTAMDGLMMGKRCGDLDPGIVLYLMQQKAMSAPEVNRLLRKQSGLLGVSGISSDMRDLIGDDGAHAREAIDLFCYRAARQAGSLIAALGGLDAFVFTAGIGANSPLIRELIVARMGFAGLAIDEKANERGDTVISAPGAKPEILVIPTNEELMIARSAASFQE